MKIEINTELKSPEGAYAVFSDCELYRYKLTRVWGPGSDYVCFVMLNPSTATAFKTDATIRKCIKFAKAWGFSGMVVVNLFAFRATNPKTLCRVNDPVGPANDAYIKKETRGREIVVAWGNNGVLFDRAATVMRLFEGRTVNCFRISKVGMPYHPLYVPDRTERQQYRLGD